MKKKGKAISLLTGSILLIGPFFASSVSAGSLVIRILEMMVVEMFQLLDALARVIVRQVRST